MMLNIVFVLVILRGCDAVIYSLNSSEYNRMPPLFGLEDFDACLLDEGGTYCLIDLDLFSDEPSDLLNLIHEYSADTKKHFNHTQIHRGVCVTRSCAHLNRSWDLNTTLEVCLNESIWRDYKIQTKLRNINYCNRKGEQMALDTSDVTVVVVYIVLIILNIIGSFYDIKFCQNRKTGNPYLLSFSLWRNWEKLVAPSGVGPDPRLHRLKSFHGIRAMTMVCVIFSHTALIMGYGYIDNPLYAEKAYEDVTKQILFNGNLVTHTFFVMSSFLLAYNFEINAEKHEITWWYYPKGLLLRWIRLTATYGLVLATIATIMRHMGSGPMWHLMVTSESESCRQYWWTHVLYINNYMQDNMCIPATWYLAADTQLFCVGLLVCVACRGARARAAAVAVLLPLALLIVSAVTYFRHLDAVVIESPEAIRSLYRWDATFHQMYVPGHTNLATYTLGLGGGLLAYHCQSRGFDADKYKKYRWIVWLMLPLGVMLILSGGIFYRAEELPTVVKVIYATLYKPLFQMLIVMFILSCIFKIESTYRCVAEWRGAAWAGRASYAAFLLHAAVLRGRVASQPRPTHMSDYNVLYAVAATVLLSFVLGAALWLCVEAPAAALVKAVLAHSRHRSHPPRQEDP